MTKKVGKDDLKKLIESVLNEDYEQSPFNIHKKTGIGTNTTKRVSKLQGSEDLTPEDFEELLKDPSIVATDRELSTAIDKLANIDTKKDKFGKPLTSKKDKEDFPKIKADARNARKAVDDLQAYSGPSSIVMPSLTSAGGDQGVFSHSQMTIFNSFFESSSTFKERMEKISNFSKNLYEAATDENKKLAENEKDLLTSIMVLDSLNFIVKDFESGSSAYLFEAFLALMGGGKILGKELTSAGKMGGADFEYKQNGKSFKGSSKYYGKGSTLEQSPDGFNVGDPVLYIVALKKQTISDKGSGAGGTSDPTKIVKLAIYSFSVEKKADGTFKFADKDGNPMTGLENVNPGKSKLQLGTTDRGIHPDNFVGDIIFATSNTSSLKEMLNDALKNQEEELRIAAQAFKDFFGEVNGAKENAQKYLANGDQNVGVASLKSIDNSQDHLEAMLNSIKAITKIEFTGEKGSRDYKEITEQKITANFLKKIIQEKFKK